MEKAAELTDAKHEKTMGKHRYMLRDGTTPEVGSKPTGWAFSDAVIQRGCSRCGSSPGFHCESPRGRKVWPPHDDRVVVGPEHRASVIRASDWLAANWATTTTPAASGHADAAEDQAAAHRPRSR